MKKTLLLVHALILTLVGNAQFEVRDNSDNSLVTNGQVLSFSDAGCSYSEPCNWKFSVTNTSSEDVYMRIFVDNLTNTDGSDFQLCFAGVCLNSVSLGSGYPNTAAVIAPGATNSAGNNFWNQNSPATSEAMSWTFRFQAFDANGAEIGTPLSVTYNYAPNLSTENFNLSSVQIFPTQVKNELTVTSKQKLNADFYDILGKKVKQVEVKAGDAQIDVSDLAPQLYIIRFRDLNGNTLVKKIIVE